MKVKTLPVFCLVFIFLVICKIAPAQVNVSDSLVLVSLYNSTNGSLWKSHDNWLTEKSVSTWAGISVQDNRVYSINLVNNNLSGKLPATLGRLTGLHDIEIQSNKIGGVIPDAIGGLSSLVYMSLSNNALTGSIPPGIGKLQNLDYLYLSDNKLTGSLPGEVGNLTSLVDFQVYNNQLSGSLPSTMGNMTSLATFSAYANQLSGSLPESLSKLKNLQFFVVANNFLSGPLPDFFTGNPSLSYVDISYNKLTYLRNFTADKFSYRSSLLANNNAFTFDGVEPVATLPLYFTYANQARITAGQQNGKLYASAGGTLASNTYKWFMAGSDKPTVIKGDSTFTPKASGYYYAVVTNAKAVDLTLKTNPVQFVAADDLIAKPVITPNPVYDGFRISGLDDKEKSLVTISNLSGNVVMRLQVNYQFWVSGSAANLMSGNYIVHVVSGTKTSDVIMIKK